MSVFNTIIKQVVGCLINLFCSKYLDGQGVSRDGFSVALARATAGRASPEYARKNDG
jgi:hypothetical protein